MLRKAIAGVATAAALVGGGVLSLVAASPATAAPATTYQKNGNYSFASNTADYGSSTYRITPWAQTHSDSSQALGADGVGLSITPGSSGYADSGVIVDLGDLNSMFDSSGSYVAPAIVGSPDLSVNYYFATSGTLPPYALNASDVYTGAAGNNYASMGAASGPLDSAQFGTFCSDSGMDEAFTALGCNTLSMSQVQAAYQAANGTEGVATADPQIYAWIGLSGSSAETGNVTSVNGTDLVTSPPPATATVTARNTCGTGQADYRWLVSDSGVTAKVNVTVQTSAGWKWYGSKTVAAGASWAFATRNGWKIRAFYEANGSQPQAGEKGALSVTAAAPGSGHRTAC